MIKPVKIRKRSENNKINESRQRPSRALSEKHHRKSVQRLLTESSVSNEMNFDVFEDNYIIGLGGQIATLIDDMQWKPEPVTIRTLNGLETLFQTPKGGFIYNIDRNSTVKAELDAPDMLALMCMICTYETNRSGLMNLSDEEVGGTFLDMCLKQIYSCSRSASFSDLNRVL